MKHGIEWLNFPGRKGETWNPHGGCSKVSSGCKNCWALRQACRFQRLPQYKGTVRGGNWTGEVNRAPDTGPQMYAPIHWRKPRTIFPCSMSDFFHPGADEWRETYWHTIYDTPQHLYLILTKRPDRIPQCLPSFGKKEWPWPNVWLGASVENEDNKQRIYDLMKVSAAKRFLSMEPLLGPVDVSDCLQPPCKMCDGSASIPMSFPYDGGKACPRCFDHPPIDPEKIDWVIVGGESGPGARPMNPEWAMQILHQCRRIGVPFFMKQMSKRAPIPTALQIQEFPE